VLPVRWHQPESFALCRPSPDKSEWKRIYLAKVYNPDITLEISFFTWCYQVIAREATFAGFLNFRLVPSQLSLSIQRAEQNLLKLLRSLNQIATLGQDDEILRDPRELSLACHLWA